MNSFDELKAILSPIGKGVVNIYKAFEFRIAGIDFNMFQVLLWGAIAYFLIDRIHDLLED